MKPILAGDILPAKEAIEAILQTDLGPTIDIPPIPAENLSDGLSQEKRQWLVREIKLLKKERNALVLSHNYQTKDLQDPEVADYVGDSLHLARVGANSDADVLVECAVLFMNQTLAIMKKPRQTILAPSLEALCSLAAHANAEKIRAWKMEHPKNVVISYINTYIDVKAETDFCCTSANASKVIQYVFENYPGHQILFLPDVHLGNYNSRILQKIGQNIEDLWLVMGACHVHDMIRPSHIEEARKKYPQAAIYAHSECGCVSKCLSLIQNRTIPKGQVQIGSTWGMIEAVKNAPEKEIVVATEIGNITPMSVAAPDKTFIPANPEAVCAFMKQNTLSGLYLSLLNMRYEIKVDPELAARARLPIERMLEIK